MVTVSTYAVSAVWVKKDQPYNFAKCWTIIKIRLPLDSAGNMQ